MPASGDRRRPRETDRSRCGQPFLGTLELEAWDPIVSRIVDGASATQHVLVGFDGETVVMKNAMGTEWYFGLGDLLDALGVGREVRGVSA